MDSAWASRASPSITRGQVLYAGAGIVRGGRYCTRGQVLWRMGSSHFRAPRWHAVRPKHGKRQVSVTFFQRLNQHSPAIAVATVVINKRIVRPKQNLFQLSREHRSFCMKCHFCPFVGPRGSSLSPRAKCTPPECEIRCSWAGWRHGAPLGTYVTGGGGSCTMSENCATLTQDIETNNFTFFFGALL